MKITGLDACRLFLSIKLHFNRSGFDFFKSRVKISEQAFEKRRDRFAFHRLAKRYDHDEFILLSVSNIIKNDSIYSIRLLDSESEEIFTQHQKKVQSLTYIFRQDLKKMLDWSVENEVLIDEILIAKESYPPLSRMVMRGDVNLETLVIMNGVLNFLPMWNRKIKEEIIWPNFSLKCEKYSQFILSKVDLNSMKKIIKEELCS